MAISKIILNGTTQMDTTQVTVDSSNLLSGYTALGRDGETLTGTTTFPVQSVNNKTGAVVLNASDVGAEPEALVVNVTQSGSTYSADKTYAQITTAAAAGKRVYAVYFGAVFIYAGSTGSPAGDVGFERMFSMDSATLTVTTANVWKYYSTSLGTYTRPSGGIPKNDLASAVQTSLGKADTALQSAPVTSVNGQTGAVSLSIPDGADQIAWTGGNLGRQTPPEVVEDAVQIVYNAIPSTASDVGAIAAPEGGSVGQVLKKTASGTEWANESGGGGTDNTARFAFEIDETNNNAVTPGTGVTISAIAAAASAGKACFADVTYVLENTSTTVLLLADYNNSYLTFTGGSYEDEQAVSLHGEDNQGADEWTATLEANLTYKLNKYQGVANAGKFMVVGNDGIVTPVAMAAWQGGSY